MKLNQQQTQKRQPTKYIFTTQRYQTIKTKKKKKLIIINNNNTNLVDEVQNVAKLKIKNKKQKKLYKFMKERNEKYNR